MAEAGVLEQYYQQREQLIELEKKDPYTYGMDHHNTTGVFTHWEDADKALDDPNIDILYVFAQEGCIHISLFARPVVLV